MPTKNNTSLIRFTDESTKKKYREIVESILYSQHLLSVSSYLIGQYVAHADNDAPMDELTKARVEALFNEFPELESLREPADIAEMFRATVVDDALSLALVLIEAAKADKVSYTNIQDVLVPLVFSNEGGLELNEAELDAMLDAVEHIGVNEIADA